QDGPAMSSLNSREVAIPFRLDGSRTPVTQVALFVSDDRGRSYRQEAAARPEEGQFRFRAPRDGVYWFVVQVQSASGHREPASVSGARPELTVCIDTRPPVARLRAVELPAGRLCAGWSVGDENLDPASVVIEYRARHSTEWRLLQERPAPDGAVVWEAPSDVEVRLRAADRAGNRVEVQAPPEPDGAKPSAPQQ